jgi:hypothetical protein
MVRHKIEGRGQEVMNLKRGMTKTKLNESKKSLLVSPKAGSARVIGPLGSEIITELAGEQKFKIFKAVADKETSPKFKILSESQLKKNKVEKPTMVVISDPSVDESQPETTNIKSNPSLVKPT